MIPSTVFWPFYDLLSLKNYLYIALKSRYGNKQKNLEKKILVAVLKVNGDNTVAGSGAWIWIRIR